MVCPYKYFLFDNDLITVALIVLFDNLFIYLSIYLLPQNL